MCVALRPSRADSPPRSTPAWAALGPPPPAIGSRKLGVAASIHMLAAHARGQRGAPASRRAGRTVLRRYSGKREKTSFSRRSLRETLALASSPTTSAAEARSSAAPGGWTLPVAASVSHSKPCTGAVWRCLAGPLTAVAALGWLAARLRGELLARGAVPGRAAVVGRAAAAVPAGRARAGRAPLRAAARRALARWGRVRGRFASTPWSLDPAAPPFGLRSDTAHIIA
jgi:hypothetical protein